MTLEDLPAAYEAARARANARALYRDAIAPPEVCRYCGEWWRKWHGSKLDGHAKCQVDAEFCEVLRSVLMHGHITYARVSALLDVSESVLRSWSFHTRERDRYRTKSA